MRTAIIYVIYISKFGPPTLQCGISPVRDMLLIARVGSIPLILLIHTVEKLLELTQIQFPIRPYS